MESRLEAISLTTLQNVCTNLCLSPDGTKRQLILRLRHVPKEDLEKIIKNEIEKEEQSTVILDFMQRQLDDENVQPNTSDAIITNVETTNNEEPNNNIETSNNINAEEVQNKKQSQMKNIKIQGQIKRSQTLQPTPQITETNLEQNHNDGSGTDKTLTASLKDRETELLRWENALLKREQEMLQKENEMLRTAYCATEQPAATGVSLQLVSNFVANYDGKTDGKFWIMQLRDIQKTYKLSDNMLRVLFATKLIGRAQSWLHSRRNTADEHVDELLHQFCLTNKVRDSPKI